MNKPIRVQRKRVKGWKMPSNTVSVTRPGKFGNPFKVGNGNMYMYNSHIKHWELFRGGEQTTKDAVEMFKNCLIKAITGNEQDISVSVYRHFADMKHFLPQLKGKNLACFCSLDQPDCHADVLIELSNK